MKAINPKNQKLVNKAVKYLTAYDNANDLRNKADDEGDTATHKKMEKKCETLFDKYLNVCAELPKREVKNIEKLHY